MPALAPSLACVGAVSRFGQGADERVTYMRCYYVHEPLTDSTAREHTHLCCHLVEQRVAEGVDGGGERGAHCHFWGFLVGSCRLTRRLCGCQGVNGGVWALDLHRVHLPVDWTSWDVEWRIWLVCDLELSRFGGNGLKLRIPVQYD